MGLLIRTLLVWLLVLAVPAQGAVAAIMAFCGPNHHGGATANSAAPAASAVHTDHHGSAEGATGHHGMSSQADEDVAALASPATFSQGKHAVHQKCSACASCCSFGAILSPMPAVPAPAVAPTVFDTVAPTVSAFAADGPDRPPRIVLAYLARSHACADARDSAKPCPSPAASAAREPQDLATRTS